MGCFDYIFIICLTYYDDETYQNWMYKDSVRLFPIACSHDEVEKHLKDIYKDFGYVNILIIIDDCAQSQSMKNRVSELVNTAFSGRHRGFSIIVLTQQFTSVSLSYRIQINKLVTFYNPSKKDMEVIDDFLHVTIEERSNIIRVLKTNSHARLEILLHSA